MAGVNCQAGHTSVLLDHSKMNGLLKSIIHTVKVCTGMVKGMRRIHKVPTAQLMAPSSIHTIPMGWPCKAVSSCQTNKPMPKSAATTANNTSSMSGSGGKQIGRINT